MPAEKPATREEILRNWCAVIDCEDYPDIDADTEEGRQWFSSLAYFVHRKHPNLSHFQFRRGGEIIGEMIVTPDPAHKEKWN